MGDSNNYPCAYNNFNNNNNKKGELQAHAVSLSRLYMWLNESRVTLWFNFMNMFIDLVAFNTGEPAGSNTWGYYLD